MINHSSFAECGCPSRTEVLIPNDWTLEGSLNLEEQSKYYKTMFEVCRKRMGRRICMWDWVSNLMEEEPINDGYSVYKKPAANVIKHYYNTL